MWGNDNRQVINCRAIVYGEAKYDDREVTDIGRKFTQEAAPLEPEVAHAIYETVSCNSTGRDEVPGELFEFSGEYTGQDVLNI